MGRCEADSAHSRDLCDSNKQFSKRPLSSRIAIRVHVLPEKLNLAVSAVDQALGFVQNRIKGPAALLAASIRNDAVGTELVAAFDDRDVTAIRIRPDRERCVKRLIGLAVIESSDTPLPCFDLNQHLGKISVRRRSGNQRNVWGALEDLLAFLLSNTPEDSKLLALRLELLEIIETMEDLLLSFIADRTSVIENQVGRFDRVHLGVSLLYERADHLL